MWYRVVEVRRSLDSLVDGVEACEGSSEGLVSGRVIHVGELELGDLLSFEHLDSSLECFGAHKILVKSLLEDFIVEGLLGVLVVLLALYELLVTFQLYLGVLESSIFDLLSLVGSLELVLLHLLLVEEVKLVDLLLVFIRSLVLELSKLSGSFSSLLLNGSLLLGSLLSDVAESLSKVLVELRDLSVVLASDLGHRDILLLSELGELGSDFHSNGLSFVTFLLSVVSLEILEVSR